MGSCFQKVGRLKKPAAMGCLWLVLFPLPAGGEPQVAVDKNDDAYRISVLVDVGSGRDLVWQVLTDYENLQRFVPGMRSSRIVSGPGEALLLEQKGQAGLLFVKVSTESVFGITETPKDEIRFKLVRGNLKRMTGAWSLAPHGHGTSIVYRAEIVPEMALPPLIGSAVLAQNVKTMVEGVVREIERRAAWATNFQPARPPADAGGRSLRN